PGPEDFALLKLVIETDSKARAATDGVLEALRVRQERYGIAGLEETLRVAGQFKGTPAAAQQDRMIELLLQSAVDAANAGRWADVVTLLKLPADLTKRPKSGAALPGLGDALKQAESLAESLASGNGQADAVKRTDLLSILQRWQFQHHFLRPDDLQYTQSAAAADRLPDSGRSLWKFTAEGLELSGTQRSAAVGFLENRSLPGRWVQRMQIHGTTSGLRLFLGATGNKDTTGATSISGLLLSLDSTALGQVDALQGNAGLLPRNQNLVIPRDAWNDFEIAVDGTTLRVRMNGEVVSQGNLPSLKPGQTGLFVTAVQGTPQAAVRIRHPRILLLPDSP
ncbi:MAG: hypothetical protein ACK5YO_19040, partial [Planctomyces sp.]